MTDQTERPGYVLHDESLPRQRQPADGAGGWLVLEAEGELDLQCVAGLRSLVAAAGSKVILDLSRVTFMDASGLGVLATAGERVRRLGGALRLVGAAREVRRLVILTRLEGVLPMFDTVPEAMTDAGLTPRMQLERRPANTLTVRVGA